MPEDEPPRSRRERRGIALIIAVLLGIAVLFRLMHLGSVPGINGDEGWWGVQATRWLHDLPYETKTTSGNPIDMAFLVPLGLLHAVAEPSFALLRVLPAAANLVALVVGFFLVRRIFGAPTAWVYTVSLAIAPTAIAHSRFCQDPSQSVLWTSITICFALIGFRESRRWWAWQLAALLAFGMAFWTHPTNIFIAPFVVLPIVPVVARQIPASRRGRTYFAVGALGLSIVGAVLVLFVLWPALKGRAGASVLLEKPWLSTATDHLTSGGAWFEYIKNYGRLFSGVTVYRYLSGPHLTAVAYGLGSLVVSIAVIAGVVGKIRRDRSGIDLALLAGWAVMLLLYFAFAGPESIRPHVERWGLCLLAPGMLVIARGVVSWMERARVITLVAASAVAFALVGSFYLSYFREFQTTGGRSHRTFITASTEPKQAALEAILAARTGKVLIVAQDWWQYWPIRYLALPDPSVTVLMKIPGDNDPDLADAIARGQLYFVEFVGSPELAHAREWLAAAHRHSSESTVADASGRPLFSIVHVSP